MTKKRRLLGVQSRSIPRSPHDAPVDTQFVASRHAHAEFGDDAIDGDPTGTNPFFGFATRGETRLC